MMYPKFKVNLKRVTLSDSEIPPQYRGVPQFELPFIDCSMERHITYKQFVRILNKNRKHETTSKNR
jgi:hypothetical protein